MGRGGLRRKQRPRRKGLGRQAGGVDYSESGGEQSQGRGRV